MKFLFVFVCLKWSEVKWIDIPKTKWIGTWCIFGNFVFRFVFCCYCGACILMSAISLKKWIFVLSLFSCASFILIFIVKQQYSFQKTKIQKANKHCTFFVIIIIIFFFVCRDDFFFPGLSCSPNVFFLCFGFAVFGRIFGWLSKQEQFNLSFFFWILWIVLLFCLHRSVLFFLN